MSTTGRTLAGRVLLGLLGLAATATARAQSPAAATPRPARPSLVVILVVDQFRGDYVDRFGHQWRHGLRRVFDEGAYYTEAAYRYASTMTCAGHATIGTGAMPQIHGMIANVWYDRAAGRDVACTEDPAVDQRLVWRRRRARRRQRRPAGDAHARRRDARAVGRRAAGRDDVDEGAFGAVAGRTPVVGVHVVRRSARASCRRPPWDRRPDPVPGAVPASPPGRSRRRRGVDPHPARVGLPLRGCRRGRSGLGHAVSASPRPAAHRRAARSRLLRELADEPVRGRVRRPDGGGRHPGPEARAGPRHRLPGGELLGPRHGGPRLRPAQPRGAGPARAPRRDNRASARRPGRPGRPRALCARAHVGSRRQSDATADAGARTRRRPRGSEGDRDRPDQRARRCRPRQHHGGRGLPLEGGRLTAGRTCAARMGCPAHVDRAARRHRARVADDGPAGRARRGGLGPARPRGTG